VCVVHGSGACLASSWRMHSSPAHRMKVGVALLEVKQASDF
jgi:hypothetical protein